MTETEIAIELNVDQSTISRDIKVLKELSQQFVFDLAKSDLEKAKRNEKLKLPNKGQKGFQSISAQNFA